MASERGRPASLRNKVECLATSKALEKSRARTWTKGSDWRWEVMRWVRETKAAVVEPEGRNANWSARDEDRGGVENKG